MTTKCMVVLSGGQDSTICLFWAVARYQEVCAVTFDYGQRHQIEIQAAINVAALAEVPHEVIRLGPILEGRSPLTNQNEALETYTDYESMQKIIGNRVERTFVPMRNALFLTLAANRAICKNIHDIVTGVCEADGANYPDCRRDFIISQERTITAALGVSFAIHAPLIRVSKAVSIRLALTLPGCYQALAYSHTAYDGLYPPTGKDHASVLRAEGFAQAGYPDPLVLRAVMEGAIPAAPPSNNYDQWRQWDGGKLDQEQITEALHDIETSLCGGLAGG